MTKADLIEEARVIEISRRDAEYIVETVLGCITEALSRGDKVELRGFGSFRARKRRGRIARNPKSGERVDVPEKRIAFFKPSKEVLELIQGKEFRRVDAAGCAVLTSVHGAGGGLKSSGQRGGILPGSRLSRSVFRMVFIHSPFWRARPPRFVDEPSGWAGADAAGFGVTPNPRIATHEFAAV